jgi:hypothetical protein
MKRLHLFEWEDFEWFPAVLRDAATAYLRRAVEVTGQAKKIAPKLRQAAETSEADGIVDLCSGGAGPVVELARALTDEGSTMRFVLTDLYPNVAALEEAARVSGGVVEVERDPVDATQVPSRLTGLRTVFNAFHHFRPEQAKAILRSAMRDEQPIAIFELVSRDPASLLGMLFAPIGVLLLMPTIRPVRVSWLFFTYVVPLVPLLVLWDGLVSCLRVYSPAELESLVADLKEYDWEIGRLPLGGPAKATYLLGRPKN